MIGSESFSEMAYVCVLFHGGCQGRLMGNLSEDLK